MAFTDYFSSGFTGSENLNPIIAFCVRSFFQEIEKMPIYEYECTACGVHEEVIQKFSDKPLTICSKCSGKLHKLISQSSFHLKGAGWYVTDYTNNAKKPEIAAKSGEKKTTEQKKTENSSTKSAE
jgi:putative FmdB family regulatory protein